MFMHTPQRLGPAPTPTEATLPARALVEAETQTAYLLDRCEDEVPSTLSHEEMDDWLVCQWSGEDTEGFTPDLILGEIFPRNS